MQPKIVKKSILPWDSQFHSKRIPIRIWGKESGIRFQQAQEFIDFENLSILQKLDFACNPKSSNKWFLFKILKSIQNVFQWKFGRKNRGIRFRNGQEFNDFKKIWILEKSDFACNRKLCKCVVFVKIECEDQFWGQVRIRHPD